jgi:hypothetical protein
MCLFSMSGRQLTRTVVNARTAVSRDNRCLKKRDRAAEGGTGSAVPDADASTGDSVRAK